MKTFKKILAGLAIFVLLAIVAGYFYVRHISRKALPDYNKSLVLTGLIDEVEVY